MTDDPASTTATLIEEGARRITACLSDLVPPAALGHLIKAQREILLALAAVVQHNVTRSTATRTSPTRPRTRRRTTRTTKPTRVDVD